MLEIRRASTLIEDVFSEGGRPDGDPLRKVAIMFAIRNPFAGEFRDDLDSLIEAGAEVGRMMSDLILSHFERKPAGIEGYGKGVIVGSRGEIEHGHALVTRPFGSSVRRALGATAWMCSNVKRGGIGSAIDVPLAYKNALAVRSHYDTVEVAMPDAPLENEMLVVLAASSRGRLHARTGGLQKSEVVGQDVYVDKT